MLRPVTGICGMICLLAACGGHAGSPDAGADARSDASAPVPDAAPDADPCPCPPAATLQANAIVRASYTVTLGRYWRFALGWSCDEEWQIVIAGSCYQYFPDPRVTVAWAGFGIHLGVPYWSCRMNNPTPDDKMMTTTSVCLDTSRPDTPALEGCDCPPVEPIEDRITRVSASASVAPQSSVTVDVGCEPGALLLAGSCVNDGDEPPTSYLEALSHTGFVPDDPDTWRCTWRNPTDYADTVTATALCVLPPSPGTAPEAVPLADRIVHVTQHRTLPSYNNLTNSVSCGQRNLLIMGSCALDGDDEPGIDEITLYINGFDASDPNSWRCSWNNPTAARPSALVTAVCLKPDQDP